MKKPHCEFTANMPKIRGGKFDQKIRGWCQISTLSFRGVNICQNCTIRILNGLYLGNYLSNVFFIAHTGRQFYPMSLIDRNIDNKNIVRFGVLTPQTWFKMNEVAFLGLIIWKKERSCQLVDARFEFYTNLPSQHHHSHRAAFLKATPLNFRSLLRENDRDYDA